jgi:hypothetical protein
MAIAWRSFACSLLKTILYAVLMMEIILDDKMLADTKYPKFVSQ